MVASSISNSNSFSSSPSVAPDVLIDFDHLALMTLNDFALERDVLALFNQQAVAIVSRMHRAKVAELQALAHTLKGSALGVGAWRIAHLTEALEQLPANNVAIGQAVAGLVEAVCETGIAIAQRTGIDRPSKAGNVA